MQLKGWDPNPILLLSHRTNTAEIKAISRHIYLYMSQFYLPNLPLGHMRPCTNKQKW